MAAIDLPAYFARIGYAGPASPTLETLRVLHRLHPAAIPFENLDPLMGRAPELDIASLEAKMLRAGRGGYCMEQNALFQNVLTALGFNVVGLAGRVLPGTSVMSTMRRTHMLLKVRLAKNYYIADVGFGSHTLTGPLKFEEGEQQTPNGPFRIVPVERSFDVQALIEGEWRGLYRFALDEQLPQDYDLANWFTATHPSSPFTRTLIAARTQPHRRIGMSNNRFSIHTQGGGTERRMLGSAAEIAAVLETEFGLTLPEPRAELDRALAKLLA